MGSCKIYKTKKEYIIVTSSKTEDWIWVADDPIFRVPIANEDSKLIEFVFKALNSSRFDVPNVSIDDVPNWQNETLKKMGQKSYTDLYKKSNSCRVDRDEKGIIGIFPYKPYTPGKLSSGLTVVDEGIVEVNTNITPLHELEMILINVLNRDYKS